MGCGTVIPMPQVIQLTLPSNLTYPPSQAGYSLFTEVHKERQPVSKNYVDSRKEG